MMVSSFPISEAQLVALFAEGVAYGMHAVTFAICMWTWVHRSKASRSARSWPWMSIAIALFLVGTLDVSFNLYHNIIAFCLYTGPGGAEGEFEMLSNWVNVLRVSRDIRCNWHELIVPEECMGSFLRAALRCCSRESCSSVRL